MVPEPCVVESGYWHLVGEYCSKTPKGGLIICEIRSKTYEMDIRASAAAIPSAWPGEVRFSVPDDATAGQRYMMKFTARFRMFRKAARWRLNV